MPQGSIVVGCLGQHGSVGLDGRLDLAGGVKGIAQVAPGVVVRGGQLQRPPIGFAGLHRAAG